MSRVERERGRSQGRRRKFKNHLHSFNRVKSKKTEREPSQAHRQHATGHALNAPTEQTFPTLNG